MEWISVKDELPKYFKKVIIYCKGRGVPKEYRGIDYGGYYTKAFGWLHSDGVKAVGVTHWRPVLSAPGQSEKVKRNTHYHLCSRDGFRIICMVYGCSLPKEINHRQHQRITD